MSALTRSRTKSSPVPVGVPVALSVLLTGPFSPVGCGNLERFGPRRRYMSRGSDNEGGPSPGGPSSWKPLLRGWSHVVAFWVIAVLGGIMVGAASGDDRWWLVVYLVENADHVRRLRRCTTAFAGRARGRSVMRRLDHSAIFLAIAGAYTPIMAVAVDGWQRVAVLARSGAARGRRDARVAAESRPASSCSLPIYVIVGWSASDRRCRSLYDALGVGASRWSRRWPAVHAGRRRLCPQMRRSVAASVRLSRDLPPVHVAGAAATWRRSRSTSCR
jgi:hypothetical protein